MMMMFEKIPPPDTPIVEIDTRPIEPFNVFVWAMVLPISTLLWIACLVWLLFFT